MICRRILTPFFALLVATSISAGDKPEGEHKEPPRPPAPEKLFERLDTDKDQVLSRAEFIRGMVELHRRAQQGGEKPDGAGDGKRPPRPEGRPEHPPGDGEGKEHPKPPAHEGGGDGDGKRPPRPEHPPGDGAGKERPKPPAHEDGGDGDGKRPPHPPKEGKGGDGEGGRPPGGEHGGPLEGAFDKADADKSGTLTVEEFKAALESLPRPEHPPVRK
jgi:EF hand